MKRTARSLGLALLALLAPLLMAAIAVPADAAPAAKKDMETFRRTYKCRYYGYREFGSMQRFSADGDEPRVYLKIDKSWKINKSKRAFMKSYNTGEVTINGKTFPPRFINASFEVDEMMLTRGHGFVGSDMDYISYYECFDLY